jgi:hypothetical protein
VLGSARTRSRRRRRPRLPLLQLLQVSISQKEC